jgi:two-component system phosphate regulon sensor histidine kinase PhoR
MLDLCAYNYLGELNEQVEEKLARIKVRLNDALNLVNNVLRISKLRLLKITTTEDLDVEKIICNLYDMNKEKFSSKNIDFIFQDDRIEKKSFNGDRVLIELAFSNVVNNSLKYSGENSKIMVVVEDTQERIIFKFIDTGVGIPERELEKVFNQFYRASNIKTANIEGTGLGLSLVKEIIERHGGKTSIKSPTEIGTLDRPGTEIIIDIPYSAEVSNPLEEKEISYDHSI